MLSLTQIIAPINNSAIDAEPSWVRDPDGRGTVGLVLSCVLTLGLCVWTAVHLNVDPEATGGRVFKRKVLWVFIGLFCPEIVLTSSFEQWKKSQTLHRRVRIRQRPKDVEDPGDGDSSNCCCHFEDAEQPTGKQMPIFSKNLAAIKCSFFIVMGGVTIPQDKKNQSTLTPEGFEYLLDLGILESDCVDTATILDKGKADFLAKFLVCVQAAWMVLQCVLRKINSLPVTLIELNTLCHVICALVMYYFWWKKPLNIGKPIMVSNNPDLFSMLFAVEMRRSQNITVRLMGENETLPDFEPGELQRSSETLYDRYQSFNALFNFSLRNRWKIAGTPPEDWKARENRKWALWDLVRAKRRTRETKDAIMLLPTQCIKDSSERELEGCGTFDSKLLEAQYFSDAEKKELNFSEDEKHEATAVIQAPNKTVTLLESEIKTLFSAARAFAKPGNEKLKKDYEDIGNDQGYLSGKDKDTQLRTGRIKNLHFDLDIVMSDIDGLSDPHILLSCLNIIYGGAHASAWNSHFPTLLEQWMWRSSCLVLALPAVVTTLKIITQHMPDRWHMDYYVNIAVRILLQPILLVYFCARIFVVVESFISIRNLPDGAYNTVQLSEYWPHFR
ncbi:hypothetical protein BZA77DRAFT_356730 [Pyronema omphalodes]|nr:hypothetical protein BZA77DRAFT_356730 [Pyronema omphalodes]